MCRTLLEGGRRCPACADAERRSSQRRASSARQQLSSEPDAAVPEAVEVGDGSWEEVEAAVTGSAELVSELQSSPSAEIETWPLHWSVDSDLADRAEVAVRQIGAALAAFIDTQVSPTDSVKRRREITVDALARLRPVGGASRLTPTWIKERGIPKEWKAAARTVVREAEVFPTAWIEASATSMPPLSPRSTGGRAYYDPTTGSLAITDDSWGVPPDPGAQVVHEFTHRAENVVPGLVALEAAFIRRRCVTEDGEPEPEVSLQIGAALPVDEVGQPDHFATGYVGKKCPIGAEVLSTGMEAVFHGSFGGLMGEPTGVVRAEDTGQRADPDHRAFVLGCLAVV